MIWPCEVSIAKTRSAEDFEAAKVKALKIGAVACYIEDIREEFVRIYLEELLQRCSRARDRLCPMHRDESSSVALRIWLVILFLLCLWVY